MSRFLNSNQRKELDNLGGGILWKNGRKRFKLIEDNSKTPIEHFGDFRKLVRNELFGIIF